MAVRIGVDVGGTFTKAVACDAISGEIITRAVVPTTHQATVGVAAGVVEAIHAVTDEVDRAGAGPVVLVSHSTTQAVNALLEGDTATVGVLGFGRRPDVKRARRRTHLGEVALAPGRHLQTRCAFIDASDGCTREQVQSAIENLMERGAEVLCASEAFGVDDPRMEWLALDVAREMGLPACAGHELSGLYGLQMRTVSSAINASILPTALSTASIVGEAVSSSGSSVPLLVMRGDGGAADLSTMQRQPLLTAFSGPAASVAGALRHLSLHDGVVVEVGGTSTNVSIVKDGHPVLAYVRVLDHVTCVRSLDVRVVGVAGGSLIRVGSRFGRPRIVDVGPRSAHIADLEYCCFAEPYELERATVQLISPRPGDPPEYAVLVGPTGKRFAPTVTCAANALGDLAEGSYAEGSQIAARRAFEQLSHALEGDWRSVAQTTIDLAAGKISAVIADAVREQRMDGAAIVGVGGGAGALVPTVARRSRLSWHIPPDSEVISSVGDALSLVRVEIERSVDATATTEVAKAHAEAEQVAIEAGADPDSLQIESRSIPERRALRVVAVGAVGLDVPDGDSSPDLDLTSIEVMVKELLGADAEPLSSGDSYHAYGLPGSADREFVVIDRRGAVALRGRGRILFGSGGEVARSLDELLPALTRNLGPLSIAPSLRLLRGSRLIDLSLYSSTHKALEAARAECALAPDRPVTAFLTKD